MFGSLQRGKRERLKGAFIKVRWSKNILNEGVNRNRKLSWKEVNKANGGKVEDSKE